VTSALRLVRKSPPNGRVGPAGQCEIRVEEMSVGAYTNRQAAWRTRNAEARGMVADRCWGSATVEIDGRRLCEKHAGARALEILLGIASQGPPP
jgi:hypothetical protein